MHKKVIYFLCFIIGLYFCVGLSYASYIEIHPSIENDYFIMELGQIATFTARGLIFDETKKTISLSKEIKDIHWEFNGRFLKQIDSKGQSITLQALKPRTTKLTVSGYTQGTHLIKTIKIVIKPLKE